MRKYEFLAIAILFPNLSFSQESASNVCFNEIMQSNIDNYFVEHDFPDSWIELYNPTGTSINILNYSITTNNGDSYTFKTNATIESKKFLIIPCDKKATGIHTNFRLDSTSPGCIYLHDANGTQIDSLSYPSMIAANIAYGCDALGNWGWELTPTPGALNKAGHSSALLPNPVFNIPGQVLTSPTTINISMPDVELPDGTLIYMTTDGSEPTTSSACGTEFCLDVNSTMVIRAKLISSTALSPRSVTNSYILHPRPTSLPVISIVTNDDYLYSSKEGIFSSSTSYGKENYYFDWRRPMNAELLPSSENYPKLNQVGEVAIAGGASRWFDQRSMKLYANKRFGKKKYSGVFWKEKQDVDKVKSFMLRNGGNNCHRSRINDAVLQRLFGTHIQNIDYQAYTPIIAYINGNYKGVYALRERSQEDYVEANYNGLEEIEVATEAQYYSSSSRKGTLFANLYNTYTSRTATYEQMANLIDVENFKNTLIAEIFSTNYDYPANNISLWRPLASGGKWKWVLKDLDWFAADPDISYGVDMFDYIFNPQHPRPDNEEREATKIYQKMISFPEFRNPFIEAFAVYLGDFLKPEVTSQTASLMRQEINNEIEPTFLAYNWQSRLSPINKFDQYNDSLHSYIQRRPRQVYKQMANFFSLGKVIPMSVICKGTSTTINDIELTEGDFHGAYFSDFPLRINSGNENYGWTMQQFHFDESGNLVPVDSIVTFCQSNLNLSLSDYEDCDSIAFSIKILNKSAFDAKIEELAIDIDNCLDFSREQEINIAEPDYAYVNISGLDSLPVSKYDNCHAYLELVDNNGNYFRKKILFSLQGNSLPKSNFSIQFCEDEWIGEETPIITFGDWVPQDEFHLKAFYNDGLRGTAEVAYQLYGQITNREKCFPRAFPVSLYINGDLYGIMSWQLKKHRNNMGLEKDNASHVWIDGTINDKQLFQDSINWTKFEVRNPKNLYNMDGSDYDGDYPQEIIDSNSPAYTGKSKMIRCNEAKLNIQKLSHYCQELKLLEEDGASFEQMRQEIDQRFDVEEIINYKVFSLISNNYDGFSNNWQWFTYDGTRWSVAPYDCNLTFGYNEEGYSLWDAEQSSKHHDYKMQKTDSVGPMIWIKDYFWNDIESRYAELRDNGIISVANISNLVSDWYNRIGEINYQEEKELWQDCPCFTSFSDDPSRFEAWISQRIGLEDEYLNYQPHTVDYELTISEANWSTICLPFSFEIPKNVNVYSVNGVMQDGCTLILEETKLPEANKPYLVYGNAGKYHLSGEYVKIPQEDETYLLNGLLVGTLEDCFVPRGSYALQNNETFGIGFYYVSSDNYIPIKANHAYLTTNEDCKLGHFRFTDNEVGIYDIHSVDYKNTNNYNYWGSQTTTKNSGFIITRMSDGSYRKKLFKNKNK